MIPAYDALWIAFLLGVLVSAALVYTSTSQLNGRRAAALKAEALKSTRLFEAEHEAHRRTRAQLEREIARGLQSRRRLERESEAFRIVSEKSESAIRILATLERETREIAFLVDQDLRYRFHTRGFAAWAHAAPERIDTYLFEEALAPQVTDVLGPLVTQALEGKTGRAECDAGPPVGHFVAYAAPHFGLPRQVTGALVRIAPSAAERAVVSMEDGSGPEDTAALAEAPSLWNDPRAAIRQAIERDEFDLHVQDIVALRPGTYPARLHELFIRMRSEERELIPPGAFLPVAEECGLMTDIDRYMTSKAIAVQKAMAARGARTLPLLCINLSRATLMDASFPDFLARALQRAGVPAECLCFEFDDVEVRSVLADGARLASALQRLGCRRSLDGFGAGSVAFSHLKAVPVDYVKIDGSIVRNLAGDRAAVAKVTDIQRVCRRFGVETIAELVESEATLACLRRLGIDYAQGFGVAKPHPLAGRGGSPARLPGVSLPHEP